MQRDSMNEFVRRTFLAATLAWLAAGPAQAADPASAAVHTGKPHRVLVGDYSKHILAIVGTDGQIEWQYPVNEIHDAWLLPGGNVLLQTDFRPLGRSPPEKEESWKTRRGPRKRQGRKAGRSPRLRAAARRTDH